MGTRKIVHSAPRRKAVRDPKLAHLADVPIRHVFRGTVVTLSGREIAAFWRDAAPPTPEESSTS